MSIRYNGEKIAGKYESQIIHPASENEAGIIKIASSQDVKDGTDNTKAVTPRRLKTNYATKEELNNKQDKLISGTNIKTLNNESLLGDGNIDITSAQWGNIDGDITDQTDLQNALDGKQPTGDYALKSEIPTKTSELTNDSDFITTSYHDNTKQDNISDINDIRTNAQTGADLAPQVAVNTQRIEDLTTARIPDVIYHGTPKITGGQVSNFSTVNYLQFPFEDISRSLPFDIYFSFTTDDDVTTQQNIIDSRFGIALAIQNAKGVMALSSNGTNWDIGSVTGINTILPNTTYYVKYSWTGSEYNASLSTNDQSYVPDMILPSNKSPYKTTIYIGGSEGLFGPNTAHPFKGIINFSKSKVDVNGITVWEGMADVGIASRANVSLTNLDEVGEKRFSDLQTALDTKQNIISDLSDIRSNAANAKSTVDTHVANGTIHVTANDKIAWSNKANNNEVVHTTGDETIAGTKTFSSKPVITSTALNINNTGDTAIQRLGTNFIRKASGGQLVLSGTNGAIYLRPGGDTATTNQVIINTDGNVTATKFSGPLTGSVTGNADTATKATQDSSGNQINTTYQRLNYSRYSISNYASTNPYIKLATFSISNTNNNDISCLFWVEALSAGISKNYALVKLSARWSGTSYSGTNFEIVEKYGDSTSCFNDLVWAYRYTTASSKGSIIGEVWMKTTANNYWTYYFRPTECNEYGDYSNTPVKANTTNWTYYDKAGTSTAIASTAITSGYTQVKVTDKSNSGGYHPPLLSCMWSDHLIDDISWLQADTFSWQDGNVYKTVYDKLVEEWNGGTESTSSIDGLTYRRTLSKYKIALASEEQKILDRYNDTSRAWTDGWYYILDTANKRFKLPRTKWGFKGLRDGVGNATAESLPNITGAMFLHAGEQASIINVAGGAISGSGGSTTQFRNPGSLTVNSGASSYGNLDFNASRSSSTYQDGAPVQERATQMYLYFYVGEYTQTAIEQTAGITTEQLNNKVDIDSSWGFPSSRYIDLTLGASGSTYTAPANGYVYVWGNNTNTNCYLYLMNTTKEIRNISWMYVSTGNVNTCYLPVSKNDVFRLDYWEFSPILFRFIYAEGAQ